MRNPKPKRVYQTEQHIAVKAKTRKDNKDLFNRVEAELVRTVSPVGDVAPGVMVTVVTPSSDELGVETRGGSVGSVAAVNVELVELFEEVGVVAFEELIVVGDAELLEPKPIAMTGTADVISEKREVTVVVLCWSIASTIRSSQTDLPVTSIKHCTRMSSLTLFCPIFRSTSIARRAAEGADTNVTIAREIRDLMVFRNNILYTHM